MFAAAISTAWRTAVPYSSEWEVWQYSGKNMVHSCIASFSTKCHSFQIPGSHFGLGCESGQSYAAQALNSSLFVWLCNEVENEHQNLLCMEVNELSWEKVLIHSFELPFQQTHFLQWFSFRVCLLFYRWVMAVKKGLFKWIVCLVRWMPVYKKRPKTVLLTLWQNRHTK